MQIQEKQEQLKKTRLEVVSLQAQLKKSQKEPSKSKPLDPWILGIALIVAVRMLWMLNKPKPSSKPFKKIEEYDFKS